MSNITLVKSIGAALRKTETAVPEIIASVPAEYDWTARGAVTAAIHAWAVPAGEEIPAVKIGAKGAQRATDYGRGVDSLAKAVRSALAGDDDKPAVLRVSLKGAGSAVVPDDAPEAVRAYLLNLLSGE